MCAQPREPDASALIPRRPRACPVCGTTYSPEVRFCPADGQVLYDQPVPADPLIGTMVADRYLVEGRLGMGGMGVVYLAQHVYMARRCALKVLRPELLSDADAIKRFVREAKNASRISHPNVAAIYDFGRMPNGQMYLAMEYVEGETLSGVLAREGTLAPAFSASVIEQAARGIQAAHDLGITHRDLKPDNIMLSAISSSGGAVKVVDFGIARMAFEEAQQVTASVMVIGTPAYMSPEQISGGHVDGRSDTYSLALVTHAILTGKLPFNASDLDLRLLFLQEPKTLRELNPGVAWPEELQTVLSRALSPEPHDRPESIQDFGGEVSRILSGWVKSPAAAAPEQAAPAIGPRPAALTTAATFPSGPLYPLVSSRRPWKPAVIVAGVLVVLIGALTVRALMRADVTIARQSTISAASAQPPANKLAVIQETGGADSSPPKKEPVSRDASRKPSVGRSAASKPQDASRDVAAVTLQADTAQSRSTALPSTPINATQTQPTATLPAINSAPTNANPANAAQPAAAP